MEPVYLGFNPFKGQYGLFGDFSSLFNSQDQMKIYTDSIGFIVGLYFLANKHNKRDIALTDIASADNRTRRKYRDYRIKRYYTPFSKPEPRRIWGADSPIELFLIHALAYSGLLPEIQTSIFKDGSVYAILRTKFEQVLRLKPSSCREQDLFSQVRGRANFDKIARPLNYKL